MKKLMTLLLFGAMALTSAAQEKVYQVDEVSVINYGDGRLLFRQANDGKAPLNGQHRLIDGYRSEYVLAEFKDGMFNGKYQHFKNNKLTEDCTYKEGNRDGVFKRYHYDGVTVQNERTLVGGKVDGIAKTYFQDGKVETEKQFTLGVENGYDRRYDSDGKLLLDQYYKDGKPEGKWTEHLSGNVGNMTRISNYKNGLREGQWSETWEDGTPRKKTSYKEGKKDGTWINYRKDGKPEKSTTYKNDEKNGEEIIYFTDGTPEKIINYANDKKNGVSKEFYFGGKPRSEFTFKNGKWEGAYKRFSDDGKLREEGNCEADYEVYRKEYYPNGKLKSVAERKGSGAWTTTERYDIDGKKQ